MLVVKKFVARKATRDKIGKRQVCRREVQILADDAVMVNLAHPFDYIRNQLRDMTLDVSGECYLGTGNEKETSYWVGSMSPRGHSIHKEVRGKTSDDFFRKPSLFTGVALDKFH